jgi:N-acetyl-D-muramate 6-phosphate phosphatase
MPTNLIQTVLFDLDGTLLDTAPDLTFALNQQRLQHHLPPLELAAVRPFIGYGSRAILKAGFDIDDNHPQYAGYLEEFLNLYQTHLAHSTQLFPEMEHVLSFLEQQDMPWGIVTNKPARFTDELLKLLDLDQRASCVVSGDQLAKRKPHPDTILFACEQLNKHPAQCVYIGDNMIDVIASKAAGTKSLVALYGYIQTSEDPYAWQADGYIQKPLEIIEWLTCSAN